MQAPPKSKYRHPRRIDPISDEEAEAIIERATALDPVHGEVIRLRLQGWSYVQIARAPGITYSQSGVQHVCERWLKHDGQRKKFWNNPT
jgi:DNA-directed RNA polymerase specialized sigma24 family protein